MAGNIKGITIEFNGDTTKLDKALRGIDKDIRAIDKELRQVDKALKFNPTNIELWRQKQDLLKQKIDETTKRLDLLKQTQAKIDSGEIQASEEDYRNLRREIIETESKLNHFEGEMKKLGNVNLKATSEQFKDLGNKLTSAGEAMKGLSIAGAAVAASIGALAVKSGIWADDLNTMSKVYGINTTELQKYKAAADLVDVSVEDIAASHLKLEKSMYAASTGSKSQSAAFEKLGVSVTNADGTLKTSDEVFQEVIASLGSMTNATERDALAQKILGKSAANLNPLIEDQGETYKNVAGIFEEYDLDLVDEETLQRANEFNDQLDTLKAIGVTALMQVGTQLSAYLAPALEKVVGWVGQLAGWLGNLSPEVLTVIGIVGGVLAVIAPLLLVLGKMAFAISSIMSLASTLGITIGALAGPIGIAIAAIAAIIAIGVLLYKNWDKIKAKAIAIKNSLIATWTNIKTKVIGAVNSLKTSLLTAWNSIKATASRVWGNIKSAITTPIQNAKDTIKGVVDKIKDFFPIKLGNLFSGLKIPHIKLPHFKLVGEFSIKNKTVPHLDVSWYKTGGIFDSPSVIGVGEAGPEAVVPLDKFWEKLDNMGGGIVINVYGSDGMSVKQLADEVQRRLIEEQKRRRLAWQ